jgi:sodium-dependent dicarboxylate transporter 2/3/5
LSLSILSFTKILPPNTIWGYLWGNTITPYFIPFFMITGVLSHSGTMEYIAKWFISRKIVKGRPYVFCFMMFLSITILGFVVSPAAMIILFFTILKEVTKSIGYTTQDSFFKAIGLSVGWVTQSQDGVRPFSKPQPVVTIAILAGIGIKNVNAATFLLFGLPFAVIVIISALIILRFFIKPDLSKFKNYDDGVMRQWLKDHPMTIRGKFALLGLIAILIMWSLPFVSAFPGLANFFNGQTIAVVYVIASILCFIPAEDGKPVMNLKQACAYVPWSVLIMIGTILFYSSFIGNEKFGISAALLALIKPIAEGLNPVSAVILGLLFSAIITNIISNLVTGTIATTVFASVLLNLTGGNTGLVIAFALAVNSIVAVAFCTMSASAIQPVIFNDDNIQIKGISQFSSTFLA